MKNGKLIRSLALIGSYRLVEFKSPKQDFDWTKLNATFEGRNKRPQIEPNFLKKVS